MPDSDKNIVMLPAASSLAFSAREYSKTTQKTEVMETGDEAPQDSRFTFCRYCGKGFESNKALAGHLRIHSQIRTKSKTGIHHIKSTKLERKHYPEEDEDEEEDSFNCFVCNDSFSSMKLLCQHMSNHRDMDSNGVRQAVMSQESNSLSEAETTVKEPRNEKNIDLLKDIVNWSQTSKRGLKKTAGDDDIIHDAVPLTVYYGPAHPQTETRKKKKTKTEETMPYQDTSMEGAGDSESTVELLGNCMETDRFATHNSNKSKSRRSMKKTNAVKSMHQCEICGKTFESGQALGGHKTYHRVRDPLKVNLIQGKTKQESCGESGEVKEYITKMLLPGLLPQDADSSEEADQNHPKRMLDFDLNIPYQE